MAILSLQRGSDVSKDTIPAYEPIKLTPEAKNPMHFMARDWVRAYLNPIMMENHSSEWHQSPQATVSLTSPSCRG